MADVEEIVKRLQSQKGVTGVIIMDNFGRTVRSTFDEETSAQHADLLHQLSEKSKNVVKELDQTNDLTFLRLRTKTNEIMIAPDKDYLVAVVYNKP
ncbi:Dynein light chain roadblock [Aphelenchoides bicaudatus]|nr:Dynein light chain roadblock [Aphelenchoides bicaudatus]